MVQQMTLKPGVREWIGPTTWDALEAALPGADLMELLDDYAIVLDVLLDGDWEPSPQESGGAARGYGSRAWPFRDDRLLHLKWEADWFLWKMACLLGHPSPGLGEESLTRLGVRIWTRPRRNGYSPNAETRAKQVHQDLDRLGSHILKQLHHIGLYKEPAETQ